MICLTSFNLKDFWHMILNDTLWYTSARHIIFFIGLCLMFDCYFNLCLWFIANNDRNLLWGHNADNFFFNFNWNMHTYHLHSTTLIMHLLIENENFNVTVYKSNKQPKQPWTQCWQLLFESYLKHSCIRSVD